MRGVKVLDAALGADDGLAARRELATLVASEDGAEAAYEQLAHRAAAGSALALELLVELMDERALPRRAVRRWLVDEAAVDDVAQDTLVAVATSIASFRGDARFTTWVHQIARNRAVDHLRRRKATEPLQGDEMGDAARISSVIASRESARQMVARLPEAYRDAVLLRDVERLPYAEVADRLGRNLNTVKSHVARGRALLARMLGEGMQP